MKKTINYSQVLKITIHSFSLLLVGALVVFASSCDKGNEPSSGNSTNGKTTAVFNPDVSYGTMTDQDGNVYKTVTIGTQTWMAENLRTTKYNNGTAIPNVTEGHQWGPLTTGAYCNYNNTTSTAEIATYGRMYNWYAVNTGRLAPAGWHVPTDAEWSTLITYLGGESVAGDKLKETGTTHWSLPNEGATNETGFTALPGGNRDEDGAFGNLPYSGLWWSSSEDDTSSAWYRELYYFDGEAGRYAYLKSHGFSVRCLKD